MDQKKIGSFIAEMRKNKNMTQKDLAERLNVSITAVSKWERGICLMDMSLLKPLSQLLDISIAEIINGEKNNNDIEYAIENTLIYSHKKIKKEKRKKYFILLISLLFIIFMGLLSYKSLLIYAINVTTNNINKYENASRKEFGAPLYIYAININDYYTFKNLKIMNVFKDKTLIGETIDSVSYKIDNDKRIGIITTPVSNLEDGYDHDNDIINREKYFKKLNIKTTLDLYKFNSDFLTRSFSIFNSLSYLKEYYFECSLYNLTNSSFDEVHEIRGDLNGYVVILDDKYFDYHIIANDIEYQIFFYGDFDYNYTKEIISTIKIN